MRFWNYLIAALRTSLPGVGEHALATLGVGGRALLDAALPALLNDLATIGEHVHLVLDDYHVLSITSCPTRIYTVLWRSCWLTNHRACT